MSEMTPFDKTRDAQAFFATKPTAFTRFLRTCIPWQMFRFVVINLKMVKMIFKSHG